jgi:hypothetical protein
MTKPTPQSNRRSGRRPPRGRGGVVCRKGSLDLGADLALALLEVSQIGACLALSEPLEPGQEVSLTFEAACSGRQFRLLAHVVWCCRGADEVCHAGFRFQKPFPYAELDHLAKT